ncbi:MAG TPA: hypothetical protein VIM63_16670, partial [Rhodoferax sp.]
HQYFTERAFASHCARHIPVAPAGMAQNLAQITRGILELSQPLYGEPAGEKSAGGLGACPISAASGGVEKAIAREETSGLGQALVRVANGSDRGFTRSDLNR